MSWSVDNLTHLTQLTDAQLIFWWRKGWLVYSRTRNLRNSPTDDFFFFFWKLHFATCISFYSYSFLGIQFKRYSHFYPCLPQTLSDIHVYLSCRDLITCSWWRDCLHCVWLLAVHLKLACWLAKEVVVSLVAGGKICVSIKHIQSLQFYTQLHKNFFFFSINQKSKVYMQPHFNYHLHMRFYIFLCLL